MARRWTSSAIRRRCMPKGGRRGRSSSGRGRRWQRRSVLAGDVVFTSGATEAAALALAGRGLKSALRSSTTASRPGSTVAAGRCGRAGDGGRSAAARAPGGEFRDRRAAGTSARAGLRRCGAGGGQGAVCLRLERGGGGDGRRRTSSAGRRASARCCWRRASRRRRCSAAAGRNSAGAQGPRTSSGSRASAPRSRRRRRIWRRRLGGGRRGAEYSGGGIGSRGPGDYFCRERRGGCRTRVPSRCRAGRARRR